jgi:hypothetical protein
MPCSFLCIAPQTVVVQSARSVVAIVVVVVVLEEELLGDTVAGKGDGRNAEAGEGALEAVEAGEGSCVAPLLAAGGEYAACVGAVVGGWRWKWRATERTSAPTGRPLCRWQKRRRTSWGRSR